MSFKENFYTMLAKYSRIIPSMNKKIPLDINEILSCDLNSLLPGGNTPAFLLLSKNCHNYCFNSQDAIKNKNDFIKFLLASDLDYTNYIKLPKNNPLSPERKSTKEEDKRTVFELLLEHPVSNDMDTDDFMLLIQHSNKPFVFNGHNRLNRKLSNLLDRLHKEKPFKSQEIDLLIDKLYVSENINNKMPLILSSDLFCNINKDKISHCIEALKKSDKKDYSNIVNLIVNGVISDTIAIKKEMAVIFFNNFLKYDVNLKKAYHSDEGLENINPFLCLVKENGFKNNINDQQFIEIMNKLIDLGLNPEDKLSAGLFADKNKTLYQGIEDFFHSKKGKNIKKDTVELTRKIIKIRKEYNILEDYTAMPNKKQKRKL